MNTSNNLTEMSKAIKKASPLYEYWQSKQNDQDELARLNKASPDHPASALFKNEPYKWEVLFQSIIREIRNGDKDSFKGLKILLIMPHYILWMRLIQMH